MNNIEELTSKARIERLKSKFEIAELYGSDQLTVPMPDLEALIAQLEAAQLELIKPLPIGELLHRLEGQTYRKWYDDDELNKWRERAEKAEAELSAANEKLSKPVVLPIKYNPAVAGNKSTRANFIWHNDAISYCADAIKAAGFTVEGE
ncbi:TPA: hypothetical protein PXS16_004301 [Yersinia enterocolitica]|nr:hypothetical protein [Yersinia enterocolitica]